MVGLHIPDSIQIAGKTWRVYQFGTAPKRHKKKIQSMYQEGTYGLTLFDTKEILLANGLSPEQLQITFIHELLHAIYDASGDQILGPEGEERVIESIDEHLYSVILQLLNTQVKG